MLFEKTFALLYKIYANNPSAVFRMNGKPSVNAYDSITQGVQNLLNQTEEEVIENLNEKIEAFKGNRAFRHVVVGGGLNSSRKLEERIELFEKFIKTVRDNV